MAADLQDVREGLEVSTADVREMRKTAGHERRARLLKALIGALVAVLSFILGYVIEASSSSSSYPYSALPGPALGLALRKRRSWLASIVIALIGVLMFTAGVFAGNSSIGIVTYYGAYQK